MGLRRHRPLFLIDISVPRNLDPQIGVLENVYLYDIDDLEGIASTNRRRRENEIAHCTAIVETQLNDFLNRISR
jgi:glutamyl-tRNA reductase